MKTVLLLLGLAGLSMACNIQQAQRCLEQFSEAEGLQPGEQPGPANTIQVADEEGLNKVCGNFNTLKSCIGTSFDGCHPVAEAGLEGVFDMMEWVCTEGRNELLRHAECLSAPSLQTETQNCANNAQGNDPCRAVDGMLECVNDAVEEECNEDAADFMDTMFEKALGPLTEIMNCDIFSASSD